jgi:ribosomal protein L29
MKTKELRDKNEKELKDLLVDNREKLRDLRFKIASRQLKNVKEVGKAKKLVARIMTVAKEAKK